MIDLMALADLAVFVGELFLVVFGSLFLVLLAAEISEWWKRGRDDE